MEVALSSRIPVHDPSQVGDARRRVSEVAKRRGLDETTAARAALVATELAGNLVKHTPHGGELLVRTLDDAGIEILSLDTGPGMKNVAECLRDGYSTAGSPGTGLGAVSRAASRFQVYSYPGLGTAVLARVLADGAGDTPAPGLEVGVVSREKPGEEVCGDGWATASYAGGVRLMVADGLGHGPGAAEASNEAARIFRQHAGQATEQLLDSMHDALRTTRGAAVALAEVRPGAGAVRFVGVGNVSGVVQAGGVSRSTVSHNGIVGYEMQRLQTFDYPWAPGSTLVMHTDGISNRWDLARYPGLLTRHPSLVAGILYRDCVRDRDDATVVVVRQPSADDAP